MRYLPLIVMLVHAHNSVRKRTKLHRCAILSTSESPWQKFYYHGDSSSFLLMTGLVVKGRGEVVLVLFSRRRNFMKWAIVWRAKIQFMCIYLCINAHKIYRMGHDPTDKFYNFMFIYVHIKFIGPVRSFMQSLCFRINAHKKFMHVYAIFGRHPIYYDLKKGRYYY